MITDTAVNPSGVLKLSAPAWMANVWFAELIRDYVRQHSLVQLEVDFSARRVNLVEEGFDLALRVTHTHHPGLVARAIAPVIFALVASREFLDRTGVPSSLDDLKGRDFLAYSSIPSDGRLTWDWPSGRRTIRLRPTLRSANETFLHLATLEALGLLFFRNASSWRISALAASFEFCLTRPSFTERLLASSRAENIFRQRCGPSSIFSRSDISLVRQMRRVRRLRPS
ncbi:LysR substrate-binding domain-containing protein [Caballeronia sp. LjRoot34]